MFQTTNQQCISTCPCHHLQFLHVSQILVEAAAGPALEQGQVAPRATPATGQAATVSKMGQVRSSDLQPK
jgi:hypothetical protein